MDEMDEKARKFLRLLWPEDSKERRSALFWGTVFGAIQIFASLIVGVILGWDSFVGGPFIAAAVLASSLIAAAAAEAARSAAVRGLSRFGSLKIGAATAVVFAAAKMYFSVSEIAFGTPLELISSLTGVILPALAVSALLTMLASYGGAVPCIIYRACAILVTVFPRQPANNAFSSLFLGFILPLFFIIALDADQGQESKEEDDVRRQAGDKIRPWKIAGTVVPVLVIVTVIAFFAGLLPVFPTAIATGSMVPALNIGDMTVMSALSTDGLEEGDIIAFSRDGATVVHRISGTDVIDGETVYYTKGDANNADDAGYVTREDIQGRLLFRVPYLGWIPLYFNS